MGNKAKMRCDAFLKMPGRVQEMFFEEMEKMLGENEYVLNFQDYCGCESPIETIFYRTLGIMCICNGVQAGIYPQVEVHCGDKTYRVDFLIIYQIYNKNLGNSEIKLVVECDGHEFHEKTKEQVAYGNKRDMCLKMNGYDVIHFSGSQIYNKPTECAADVIAYLLEMESKYERC